MKNKNDLGTILVSEHNKKLRRTRITSALILINIIVWSTFAYSYHQAYQSIQEQEMKLISKLSSGKLAIVKQLSTKEAQAAVEPTDMREWIKWYTESKGLDWEMTSCVIEHESGFREMAYNINKGGKSLDRGLWMWNDKWNKHISNECAFDYKCATVEAVKKIKNDGGYGAWYGSLKCK